VLVIAVILGLLVALTGFVLYRRVGVASVLGLAVAGSTLSALFPGLIIPLVFRKIGVDPANASGPLGTIIQDAASVIIYFSIAGLLL
jgi:magnesium transporter